MRNNVFLILFSFWRAIANVSEIDRSATTDVHDVCEQIQLELKSKLLRLPVAEHKAVCAAVCARVLTLNDSPGSAPPRSCSKPASGKSSQASSLHTRAPRPAPSTPAPMTSLNTNTSNTLFN